MLNKKCIQRFKYYENEAFTNLYHSFYIGKNRKLSIRQRTLLRITTYEYRGNRQLLVNLFFLIKVAIEKGC